MFSRQDWTLFRNLNTISQKAGVPLSRLRRLVFKEMVDNALDAAPGQPVRFGKEDDNTYWVEDDGPGLNMNRELIADLFSINRPLTSTKILRRPSRGALGNGLRVIVGSAIASGGSIVLESLGRRYNFVFDEATGKSQVSDVSSSKVNGTRLSVTLGNSIPEDDNDLSWGKLANGMHMAHQYKGKSSPWWYDSDSFYELLLAAGDAHLVHLVKQFEGVTTVGPMVMGLPNYCKDISREEAEALMTRLRVHAKDVSPKCIGYTGFGTKAYGTMEIKPGRGKHSAHIPYCVEASATPINDDPNDDTPNTEDLALFYVNSTPITGRVKIERQGGGKAAIFGCGISHYVKSTRRRFMLFLNVTTPYMPITTDGKEPNFEPMLEEIFKVVKKATSQLKSNLKGSSGGQRDIILDHLDEAINTASGDRVYRYSLRQLFYAVRPFVLADGENKELDYNYFGRVITEYENSHGELPGIYRDPRGTLYHPHEGLSIPIGTLAVEEYKRPEWTFNKILYCEKEGFFSVLQQVKWPERNDCALLSSKGFASRAVRDVLDLLGDTGEDILFFAIHDADASGTLIYQALAEETLARGARSVKIINLGLDPWEALDDGLQTENFTAKRTLPVARYVKEYDEEHGTHWKKWLQTQRVELNAMTSPQFLAWLDRKMADYHNGKVIPPEPVMRKELMDRAEAKVKADITERILREQKLDNQVAMRMDEVKPELNALNLNKLVKSRLKVDMKQRWDVPIKNIADETVQ